MIGIIIPTYGHFDYATRAVRSALTYTETRLAGTPAEKMDARVYIVDDASPDWDYGWPVLFQSPSIDVLRFTENGGLTRSWNHGIRQAVADGCEYVCVTNSDVIFSPGWFAPIAEALEKFALVGPVTNAPGNQPLQDVLRYKPIYDLLRIGVKDKQIESMVATDDETDISDIARMLSCSNLTTVPVQELNGFCMVAKSSTWKTGRFDADHFFKPRNDFNSRGERNATPLMTLNDCELCARYRRDGLRIGVVRRSYVFHYRSVSRGDRYKQPGWVRAAR